MCVAHRVSLFAKVGYPDIATPNLGTIDCRRFAAAISSYCSNVGFIYASHLPYCHMLIGQLVIANIARASATAALARPSSGGAVTAMRITAPSRLIPGLRARGVTRQANSAPVTASSAQAAFSISRPFRGPLARPCPACAAVASRHGGSGQGRAKPLPCRQRRP